MKNIESYRVAEIDEWHFKRQYYDLKEKKKDGYGDMMWRNKGIKMIINNYSRSYNNFRGRQGRIHKLSIGLKQE